MPSLLLGIRKFVEEDQVKYWLLITAKPIPPEDNGGEGKATFSRSSFTTLYLQLVNSIYWKIFVIITVMFNLYVFTSYFWLNPKTVDKFIMVIIVLVHTTCLVYWIDFVGALIERVVLWKHPDPRNIRPVLFLVLDLLSLLPLSTLYLIIKRHIDIAMLWQLRSITVLRFYRIPRFFAQLSSSNKNHWDVLLAAYASYLILFIVFFANMFLYSVDEYSGFNIEGWNDSSINRIIASLYYTLEIVFNVGYGDIEPMSYSQILLAALGMAVGTAASTGIFSGILGIAFTSRAIMRENYRYEFEATKNTLQERNIDKKVINDILDNINILWTWKKGYNKGPPPVHILPVSLKREMYFDVNFPHLHRSLIFSNQPRSFLRRRRERITVTGNWFESTKPHIFPFFILALSLLVVFPYLILYFSVSMFMKNLSYLPGDIILEPSGMSDVMICVASGVIEVLSPENDESVLFSLTAGTIIGEASLFIPLPIRCIIRASTYVELQVLMKLHFARLALTYPNIFRSMRSEIFFRLEFQDDPMFSSMSPELKRRRGTKTFLANLRNQTDPPSGRFFNDKAAILKLYALSEDIPRVKTLPINLIRARPWILRPDTTFTKFWNLIMVLVITFVCIAYPVMTAFVRKIDPWMYVILVATRAFYIVDVYLQCTTAIERKDHFTYKTSIKEIVSYRLTTVGFYLDVISMYYLGIYGDLIWPENMDYAHLLLSLNALLKAWQVFSYLKKAEDDMRNNLLYIITIKYATAIAFILTWGAALLYVEARPGETYIQGRWFYTMEMAAVHEKNAAPRSLNPVAVSFYFAAVTTFALGYGDLVANTIVDCVVVIICLCSGFALIVLCMAESAAAIKHLARIRTNYQEELFAVDLFMVEHEIPEGYRLRVRNYMRLQWDYDKGYSLKQISIAHTHPGLQRRIIMMELSKSFLCVQLFQNVAPDFLKLLAKLCKVRVLPPQELVTIKGSFIRELYIIENGFCEATRDTPKGPETKIIGPLSPFGAREMILGEQQRLHVETVTHVRVISLKYASYLQAVTKYPSVKVQIDDTLKTYRYDDQDEGLGFGRENDEEDESRIRLQKQSLSSLSKTCLNMYKYHRMLGESYWEPFRAWGKCQFLQFLLLPMAIMPNTNWFKTWVVIRMIKAVIIGILAPIQFSLIDEMQDCMPFIIALQVLYAIDIYFMFHVAYYDNHGLLMFHPAETAPRYLKGNFIVDLIIVFPFFWLLDYIYPHAQGYRGFSIKTSGLIMTLQLYLLFQGFNYLENDILKKTDLIKILKLFPIVVIVINFITGFVLLLQCYEISMTNASELQGSTRLAQELVESIKSFCTSEGHRNVTHSPENTRVAFKMYVITLYWVTTTITVCGFGDIYANNETTMIIVVLILSLGIFFFSYTFASITSSMVTTNVLISKHRKKMLKMMKFLKKENVSLELQERYLLHYEYNWKRTEGQSPQKIFSYFHAALREGIIKSMYEATLSHNPIFKGLENAIVSIIGKHLEEMYFLQGETIIKYKDIQEDVYLIYRGEVHVLNAKNEFIASMGSGGMFGNINNKPFSVSSESVVASENTDLIRMDGKAFFSELKDNPTTNTLLSYLTKSAENYVLPSPAPLLIDETSTPMKLNVFRLKAVPAERRGMSSSHLYHISGFYCRNMVFYLRFKPHSTFVILPGTILNDSIEMCIFGMAYLSATLTFYMFAFQDFAFHILIFLYILDLIFLIEIFLQLHMSHSDKFGDVIVSMRAIKKRYLKSKKFYFDIISNCPLEVFMFAASRDWWLKLLSILRLNRVLRLHYIFSYYYKKKKELRTNKIFLEIGWILVIISLMIHTLACIWFVAVAPLGYYQEPTWVTDMNLEGKNAWEYYIYSVFHIVIVTTTTGLQKLHLYSLPEIVLTMIFMITCRYVVVLMSGLLVATINADSLTLFLFQQRTIELKETFSRQNISSYQLRKMWNYLTTLWCRESGRQMPKFISTAPYTMKCEVMMAMFGKHLFQSYVFSQTDLTFLRQLASHLKRFVYFPGNYIVQQGDIDYTMYFINKGLVSVLTIHPELIETIHFTLTENDHFGLKQGFVIGKAHEFSYRAETEVEILSLTLSDWRHLLKYFPEEAKKINKRIESMPKELL